MTKLWRNEFEAILLNDWSVMVGWNLMLIALLIYMSNNWPYKKLILVIITYLLTSVKYDIM